MVTLFSTESTKIGQDIILALQIVTMIISIFMIIVGLVQNKQSQTGLSALNGGNEELFSNSKERGLDKTLSLWMTILGVIFFAVALAICIITNTML